jgi:WD40 repeat protein
LFAAPLGIGGSTIDFSADGRKLAVGRSDGRVTVLDLALREIMHTLELKLDSGASRMPQVLRFNPSGNLLAACSLDDQYVEIWNLATTQRVARPYHPDLVHDIAWHPRGQLLAAACEDSRVYLWQTNDFRNATKLAGHEGPVTAVAFNNRGTLMASLGNDETVRLWISATGRQMAGRSAGKRFDRLRFSADDLRLIGTGREQLKTCVWETFGGELTLVQVEGGRGANLRTIDFSPDSQWFVALGWACRWAMASSLTV